MTDDLAQTLTVYIVDDEAAMRDSLALMLGLQDYRTACFASAEAFLDAYQDHWTGCVVADLKLPGKSGLELLDTLHARGAGIPLVIITGHGDVQSARAAFTGNAVDFLEKPVEDADLRAAIEKGFERELRRIRKTESKTRSDHTLAILTKRELEILSLVGEGLHAKEIGRSLGISPRTVEVHKAHMMEKIKARNVAELVRFAISAQTSDPADLGETP